jgi:carbamate kinase
MGGRVLVALGGNAILKHGEEGTAEEQFANVRSTCEKTVKMMRNGSGDFIAVEVFPHILVVIS